MACLCAGMPNGLQQAPEAAALAAQPMFGGPSMQDQPPTEPVLGHILSKMQIRDKFGFFREPVTPAQVSMG